MILPASDRGNFAIVVGGGPAPGINGVISSVTIEASNRGHKVIGIRDGFKNFVLGDYSKVVTLIDKDVAPYYQKGGSMLGTSRTNPAKDPAHMKAVIDGLHQLGVKYLVTIGGDDTAYSGSQVYANANKAIKVAHVPKTIDNDLPLPPGVPTFGFETARHYGVLLALNLREDAKTTTRWCIVVSMGRAAGHLALGIGKASAAALTIIAEELAGKDVTLDLICDTIIGSMIKRQAKGRGYGLVVLAEGLLEAIGEKRLTEIMEKNPGKYGKITRDQFGHIAYGDIEFGRMMRTTLKDKLADLKLKIDMIDKDLGYELRCADPIPFDAEYTRNLGYGAVKFLTANDSDPRVVFTVEEEIVDPDKHGVVITFDGGKLVPRPFEHMIDLKTLKMRPRLVDVLGETYEVARRYMIRLEKSDFSDPVQLQKLADVIEKTPQEFLDRFGYLVK